tara:strand:+ start:561 stop:1562 length:1002 start_codon:yes stop_codon:yes gene_type:complete
MFFVLSFSGCAGELQTKVSHDLARLSTGMIIAILPVQTTRKDQEVAAKLFRQNLYASLEETKFHVMERYMVDSLLHQKGIFDPEHTNELSPIDLGEILGADAVIQSIMTKMDRTYALVHSSIELGVSVKMTDTRSGEVLWMANQTENDYDGIAKIPTGITSVALAPVQFITNKVNLHHLTQTMTEKLTAPLKNPTSTSEEEFFPAPIIATSAAREIEQVATHPQKLTVETTTQPRSTIKRQSPIPEKMRALPKSAKLFTVQVGAYKNKVRAKEVISDLSAKGYKVYLYSTGKPKSEVFKIHVEKFNTREEAFRYGLNLGRKEKLDQFVTHFPE